MNALEIAAVALQHDAERLKAIAHNVANLATTGYARRFPVHAPFAGTFDAAAQALGHVELHADATAGRLQPTGRALDLALGDGVHLLVQRTDGTTALTRHAALQVDADGRLTTHAGLAVVGHGGELKLPRGDADVSIDATGTLRADERVIGTLRLVSLRPGVAPEPLGDGLFAADPAQWRADAPPPALRSGHLEASNVVPSQEMVRLMGTARHAESMARLLQHADQMNEKAIRTFGETG